MRENIYRCIILGLIIVMSIVLLNHGCNIAMLHAKHDLLLEEIYDLYGILEKQQEWIRIDNNDLPISIDFPCELYIREIDREAL